MLCEPLGEPLLSVGPVWLNWHQVWLTVPSICSGSQGRECWLHHTASPQQLPDLPCCIGVGRWGFPLSLDVLYYTLRQIAAAVGAGFLSFLISKWCLSPQAAAGWMLWSWLSAAPASTSWRPKPGERQTSARLPSLPISSTCCRPVRSMTQIFYSKQPTQPRASQTNSVIISHPIGHHYFKQQEPDKPSTSLPHLIASEISGTGRLSSNL